MKKITFNVCLYSALCTVCVLFFSCEMFTTSLAKGARRDPRETLKNLSASELIAFSQTTYTADSGILTATFELLGKKNKEELKTLSLKEKEQFLDLLPDAGFPIKNLKTIAAEAFQVGQSGATEESDKAFVKKLITAVQLFDTEAASTLSAISDESTVFTKSCLFLPEFMKRTASQFRAMVSIMETFMVRSTGTVIPPKNCTARKLTVKATFDIADITTLLPFVTPDFLKYAATRLTLLQSSW